MPKEVESRRNRREFLRAGATVLGALAGVDAVLPGWARSAARARITHAAPDDVGIFDLKIGRTSIPIGDRIGHAMTINGSLPAPLLRFREGETVTLRVSNALDEDTSVHWHGVLVPNPMDGVPHVTYPGIKAGETFVYRYTLRQSGTYWYHSHTRLQEQLGLYGPLIIDPAEPDPISFDREYVVMLSDWTFENPYSVLAHLKKGDSYYNYQRRTVLDLFRHGGGGLADRLRWGRMRMDPTDIADVTGATYRFLMNGQPPERNWTALYRPGERVRLRFINSSAATYFDVRIPGLPLTVVQADGQNVQPVQVDEFRIAIAETYDVIVQPPGDGAFTIFAETMDRSGYTRGTLATRAGETAPIPPRRPRPVRSMADMGMHMGTSSMAGMDMPGMTMPNVAHAPSAMSGCVRHGPDHHGPENAGVPEFSCPRLDDPGVGLEHTGHRVLVYQDLKSTSPWYDTRPPAREIELHLTGNMDRYIWGFDGKKYSEAKEPIPFRLGERLRMTLVNDTMMEHPIHLHGMWMQVENGFGAFAPRKHTVNVKPAERLSVLITPDALGKWALHCHILYHMETGMFRVVGVTRDIAMGS